MSLLMEALRKAEEAKSKAAKEKAELEQTDDQNARVQSGSMDELQASTEHNELSTPDSLDLETGPLIINPDPDELETLSLHLDSQESPSDATVENTEKTVPKKPIEAGLDELTLEDLTFSRHEEEEIEQIEFNTSGNQPAVPVAEEQPQIEETPSSAPEPEELPLNFDNDDTLSLLESSYFSRVNTGRSSTLVDDEDLTPVSDIAHDDHPLWRNPASRSHHLS